MTMLTSPEEYCTTLCCSETAFHNEEFCATCQFGLLVVVLDLDETLICADYMDIDKNTHVAVSVCGKFNELIIYKRTGLDHFLETVFSKYQVYIWTAAPKEYTKYVVGCILKPHQKLQRLLTRKDTIFHRERGFYFDSSSVTKIKPLKKIRKELSRVVMIDDTATVLLKNMTNGILRKPFNSPKLQYDDNQLMLVLGKLDILSRFRDVRSVLIRN